MYAAGSIVGTTKSCTVVSINFCIRAYAATTIPQCVALGFRVAASRVGWISEKNS